MPREFPSSGEGGSGRFRNEKNFFSRGGPEAFQVRRTDRGDPENERTGPREPSVGELRGGEGKDRLRQGKISKSQAGKGTAGAVTLSDVVFKPNRWHQRIQHAKLDGKQKKPRRKRTSPRGDRKGKGFPGWGGGVRGGFPTRKKIFSRGGHETFWVRRGIKGGPENAKTRPRKHPVGEMGAKEAPSGT